MADTSQSSTGGWGSTMDNLRFIVSVAHHSLKKLDSGYTRVDSILAKSADTIFGREKIVPKELDARHDEKSKDGDPDRLVCAICMSNLRNVLYLPCNHVLTCNGCSIRMASKKCPYCAQDIKEMINVRMP